MKMQRITSTIEQWSLKPGTLHERLAAAIQEAIQLGSLPPGIRVPAERALARELAISRTTVLTAYNHLRDHGWLESRSGSGTWIARRTAAAARASTRDALISQSTLFNLLTLHDSGAIDFAVNTTKPLADLPKEYFKLSEDLEQSLLQERNYMPLGLPMLRDAVANHYSAMGVPTRQDQVLITTGAQQAISLIAAVFVQRGDWVLTENPTYFGALEAFRLVGARLIPIDVGEKHIDPAALLRRLTTHSPRLIYTSPLNQNPTGASMREATCRELARLSGEYGVPLIEDETLAEMSFGGKRPRPIAAFAGDGPVLTVGSMSKLFLPGIRIGWVRGPVAIISRLAKLKATTDLGSPLLTQAIGWQLFSHIPEAVRLRKAELSEKRQVLAGLLRTKLPEWTFADTKGVLALWVHTPGMDSRLLSQVALRHQLALAPGTIFSVDDSFSEFLRIPFLDDLDTIHLGVERLVKSWLEIRKTLSPACSVQCPLV